MIVHSVATGVSEISNEEILTEEILYLVENEK